jgi:putative transposase
MFSISRFNELLQNLPKTTFQQSVEKNQTDKYVKKFQSKDLLTLMLYGQWSQSASLRQLVTGFNVHNAHHYHLNMTDVKRSTVSEALQNRSVEPFKQTCEGLLDSVARPYRNKTKELICIIDSTPISLRDYKRHHWAEETRTPSTMGLKLHVALDVQQQAPFYTNITHANVNDLNDARNMALRPNTTYVVDKGYCDYNWWFKINDIGSWFVTRLKYNAAYRVMDDHTVTSSLIISDQTIQLTNTSPGGGRTNAYANKNLRKITVKREGKEKPLIIVTNDFSRSADEIAALYKQRWDIELFFKWIKQKLKIKRFFGDSENAIRLQIYVAIIAYLLMHQFKQQGHFKESLSVLAIELKSGLFLRRKTDYHYYKKRRERIEQQAQYQQEWCI